MAHFQKYFKRRNIKFCYYNNAVCTYYVLCLTMHFLLDDIPLIGRRVHVIHSLTRIERYSGIRLGFKYMLPEVVIALEIGPTKINS